MNKIKFEQRLKHVKRSKLMEIIFHVEQDRLDRELANAARRKSASSRKNLLGVISAVMGVKV